MANLIAQAPPGGEGAVDFAEFNRAIFLSGDGNIVSDLRLILIGGQLSTPGGLITRALPYLFTIGGMIVFVMLIWGAWEIQMGAANPKSAESGKQRITHALVGLIILFASYWIAQIIQVIFGLSIGV